MEEQLALELLLKLLNSFRDRSISYPILIRSVAQLVEHRSPKPGAAGSSPATPANKKILVKVNMNTQKKKTSPAQFVRQVRQELQKVIWPQRRDTFISSAIVILLIILFSLFFLLTDQIWSFSIRKIIEVGSGF